MMSIHQRIKERRIACGYSSHKALAAVLGLSWQTVQQWEKEGGTAPNRSRIDQVAEVLKVSPSYLLHGEDTEQKGEEEPSAPLKFNAPDPGLQLIGSREYYLLHLFRGTDSRGQDDIISYAERMPRVNLLKIVSNQS